jgi:hypothetical protein
MENLPPATPGGYLSYDSRFDKQSCEVCRREVGHEKRRGRWHVFCSALCEYTYHNRRLSAREQLLAREDLCEVCGKEFTAKRAHTKTCSPACKQKAYQQRKKGAA